MNVLPRFLTVAGDQAEPDHVESESYVPKDDHVMSRDTRGNIVSVYGDPAWDYSMFPGRIVFIFDRIFDNPDQKERFLPEIKFILFKFIYSQAFTSFNSIEFHWTTLKQVARMANGMDVSIGEAVQNSAIFDFILDDPELSKEQIGSALVRLKSFLGVLHTIACQQDDFDYSPNDKIFEYLEKLCEEYPVSSQQTPVIPTRLLSRRIESSFEYIEKFLSMKSLIFSLYEVRKQAEDKWREAFLDSESPVGQTSARITKDFLKELNKPKYEEFREFFGVYDFVTLRSLNTRVRLPMKEMIHAFSGMRDQEANSLAMDAYKVKLIGRQPVSVLRSYTTKMARDSGYFADWVTTPEIEKVFEAGRVLNECILRYDYGMDPREVEDSDVPLFLGYHTRKNSRSPFGLFQYPVVKTSLRYPDHPLNTDPEIIVSEGDIAEIFAIDPSATPESLSPLIVAGEPFCFQTHMYRRSLAVYSSRSGLVSLPTLKKQLKHIAIQTSAFYGNDAAFAKNLILPKSNNEAFDSAVISQRGFIKEFHEELAEGQTDLLYSEVITADQIVFGGMGTQIQKQKNSGTLPTVFTDREQTKKAVKQGRLRHSETPLGGCMSVKVCHRIAFSSITTCIGCGESVFNNRSVDLLKKTKAEYQVRLDKFGKSTPYGMQLERDIRDIDLALSMREKLIDSVDITGGAA